MQKIDAPFDSFLREKGVVVIDGALATELEQRGAQLDDPLWSAKALLESPDLVRQVHLDYFLAGADVAISASYQATFEALSQRGLTATQAADLMQLSVQLACEARTQFWADKDHREGRTFPLVAASIGSYGAYLADGSEYRGDYGLSLEELMSFHRGRMEVLSATEADLLACETIPCRIEGEALLRLLAEFADRKVWLSFSCSDGERVCHGETFRECVELVNTSEQVVAVGLNCTPPQHVESLLRYAAGSTQKPLLAYPNSGEAWDPVRRCWVSKTTHKEFSTWVSSWYAAGARLIGGCCRTRPEDIRKAAQALAGFAPPPNSGASIQGC